MLLPEQARLITHGSDNHDMGILFTGDEAILTNQQWVCDNSTEVLRIHIMHNAVPDDPNEWVALFTTARKQFVMGFLNRGALDLLLGEADFSNAVITDNTK